MADNGLTIIGAGQITTYTYYLPSSRNIPVQAPEGWDRQSLLGHIFKSLVIVVPFSNII